MVTIDGTEYGGGGQMLRTALSLAMATGQAFNIRNIRASKEKPGLLRQHLMVINACASICDAKVDGDTPRSPELSFTPGKPMGGDYSFALGTVGSTTLVAQTLIPALMLAEEPSTLSIKGCTHNILAPPHECLARSFLPLLGKMGVAIEESLHDYGFEPAGGGQITLNIKPVKKLRPLELTSRGKQKHLHAESLCAFINVEIAKRELDVVKKLLQWPKDKLHIREVRNAYCTGNALLLTMEHEQHTEVAVRYGEHGTTAETVAKNACAEAKDYLDSDAAIGVHLADQILLPMALAGEGSFTTLAPSPKTETTIKVIEKFIPRSIEVSERKNCWLVTIGKGR